MPDSNTPASVYRYYDSAGVLIYVGLTTRRGNRNTEHNKQKEWWSFVVSQKVDHFKTLDSARTKEAYLIDKYRPPFNKYHNPDHREIQLAYDLVRRDGLFEQDVEQILKDNKKVIPLTVHTSKPGYCEFRTKLEHAAVTMRINQQSWRPPKLHKENGGQIGAISQVLRCGPLLRLIAHQVRRESLVHSARAKIRRLQDPKKPPFFYEIKSVVVVADKANPKEPWRWDVDS